MQRKRAPHQKRETAQTSRDRYLIHFATPPGERDELWEVCRQIEHLGGIEVENGYEFSSERRRDEAVEILIETWGAQYFESHLVQQESLPRLLLAMTNVDQRTTLGRYFRQQGVSVEIADDAIQAKEMLLVHRPHALVIEEGLPWGGGDGLLSCVRAWPDFEQLPVIFLQDDSNHESSVVDDPFVVARFCTPVRLSDVRAAIQAALRHARMQSGTLAVAQMTEPSEWMM